MNVWVPVHMRPLWTVYFGHNVNVIDAVKYRNADTDAIKLMINANCDFIVLFIPWDFNWDTEHFDSTFVRESESLFESWIIHKKWVRSFRMKADGPSSLNHGRVDGHLYQIGHPRMKNWLVVGMEFWQSRSIKVGLSYIQFKSWPSNFVGLNTSDPNSSSKLDRIHNSIWFKFE